MTRSRLHRVVLAPALLALGAHLALGASAQQGGITREQMWWAPTREDWKRPCLITWQRTWEDAVKLSRQTGKMILVCINMDGEIASEHYAGVRYRQPEIAALYEPYVTVIASVYRHTPRDHDEQGRRIPCPRFGGVTCGEHIAIEPILFEKFMEGRRIAPRHIGVELDGAETYDVYYAYDTDSVFQAIHEGARHVPPPGDQGERSLAERVASPDSDDRTAVEGEYVRGDRTVRRELMRAAIEAGDAASVDLLRLAVFDLDLEMNRLAWRALAQATSEDAIGLINEALRVPMDAADRDALIAALVRLGETYPRARTLAAVHQGLAARSETVDLEGWSTALGGAEYPAREELPADERRLVLVYEIESRAHESTTRPEDPLALLDYAEAALALAVDPQTAVSLGTGPKTRSKYANLMFEDVRRSALRAEELGGLGEDRWRADAVLALAAYYQGEVEEAHARAEAAVQAMPSGEEDWNAMAVLALFAQARQQAIESAVREKREWPKEWLTDVNAAYSVLARHPLGTDYQIAAHNDFLRWLGAFAQAERVLDEGLGRFPDSPELHARLRGRILWQKGAAGLGPVYEAMLREDDASPNLEWFAGYAALVAAEYHRRASSNEEALAAYDRGIAHYVRAIEANPESRDSAEHYIAIAIAGRARLALEARDYERALSEILASFERKPEAAATLDGLGLSAVATARTLQARLEEEGRVDMAAEVQAALDGLAPELLLPPAFETQGRPSPDAQRAARRQRGR